MLSNLENTLYSISFIYGEIYKYLKPTTNIETQISNLADGFINDKVEIVEKYTSNIKSITIKLDSVKKTLENLKNDDLDEKTKFILLFSLLKYVYHHIQSEMFLYNTILNKTLFEYKFEKFYFLVLEKYNISKLLLLQIIEDNTSCKYTNTETKYEKIQDEILSLDFVKKFITQFSYQKSFEKKYNEINNKLFSPLLIEIRSELHNILENNNLMPVDAETQNCLWKLIPYIENNKSKMGFYD